MSRLARTLLNISLFLIALGLIMYLSGCVTSSKGIPAPTPSGGGGSIIGGNIRPFNEVIYDLAVYRSDPSSSYIFVAGKDGFLKAFNTNGDEVEDRLDNQLDDMNIGNYNIFGLAMYKDSAGQRVMLLGTADPTNSTTVFARITRKPDNTYDTASSLNGDIAIKDAETNNDVDLTDLLVSNMSVSSDGLGSTCTIDECFTAAGLSDKSDTRGMILIHDNTQPDTWWLPKLSDSDYSDSWSNFPAVRGLTWVVDSARHYLVVTFRSESYFKVYEYDNSTRTLSLAYKSSNYSVPTFGMPVSTYDSSTATTKLPVLIGMSDKILVLSGSITNPTIDEVRNVPANTLYYKGYILDYTAVFTGLDTNGTTKLLKIDMTSNSATELDVSSVLQSLQNFIPEGAAILTADKNDIFFALDTPISAPAASLVLYSLNGGTTFNYLGALNLK